MKITVDRDFARFGAKSYAINKINTVEVREERPNRVLAAVCMVLGGLFAFSSFGVASQQTMNDAGTPLTFGVIALAVAVWGYFHGQVVEYRLYLVTSSSEAQALTTRDKAIVNALREKIELAMVGRLDD